MGEDKMNFNENWSMGCSDIGDVCCVMPTIQPSIGGTAGVLHGKDFHVEDPVLACVTSAKVQCGTLALLLENGAQRAKDVLAKGRQDFPSISEYLAKADRMCMDMQAVDYHEDGSVTLNLRMVDEDERETPCPV
jgi:hypothetical protein